MGIILSGIASPIRRSSRLNKIFEVLLKVILPFLLVATINIQISTAQPNTAWIQTYGGPLQDEAFSVVQTNDGGYALAGHTTSIENSYEFYLVKTDELGNMQWNKTYGQTGQDNARSLIQTSDGGYAMAGSTILFGDDSSGYNVYVVKTDSAGNLEWNKTYGGMAWDFGQSIIETTDGGYAIAGFTTSFGAGYNDVFLIRADENGNLIWNKTYGDIYDDLGRSIVQTNDGGFAIAGSCTAVPSYQGTENFYLVKTDAAGNMEWNKSYGGFYVESGNQIVQASDGGYAIVGTSYNSPVAPNREDALLVKTDGAGNMQWSRSYGGTGIDYGYSVVETGDGGFAIAGTSSSYSPVAALWLIKTDSEGILSWNKTIESGHAFSMVETEDGGYALAGYSVSEDFILAKVEAMVIAEFPSNIVTIALFAFAMSSTAAIIIRMSKFKNPTKRTM